MTTKMTEPTDRRAAPTPGPWGLYLVPEYEDGTDCVVLDADGFAIATVEARPVLNRWPEKFPRMRHWSVGAEDGRTLRKRPRAEVEANARLLHSAPALVAALHKAKDSLGALISAVEQHHATSPCTSEALFSEADRQYRVLEAIRAALALVDEKPS